MLKQQARIVSLGLLLMDGMVTVASFVVAYWIRGAILSPILERPIHSFGRYSLLLYAILPAWGIIFWLFGLYRSHRTISLKKEVWEITKAVLTGGAFMALVIFMTRTSLDFSRLLVGIFIVIDWAAISASRIAVRTAGRKVRARGYNIRSILIVGTDRQARNFQKIIHEHPYWGLVILGFINPDGDEAPAVDHGEILGRLEDLPRIIQESVVDEVFFVVAPSRLSALEDTFLLCEEQGIKTRVIMEYLPRQMAKVYVEMVEGLPMLTFSTAPVDASALMIKRAADILLSLFFLVVTAPLMLIIALAVRLSSPGPVLFRQVRCGLNGRRFTLYKFRSMYRDAEEKKAEVAHLNVMDGPVFKVRDDPRATPVGKIIRAYSLDELPQLFNVLIGDMSFVGPRPPIPEEVSQYQRWQRRRLSMKPGLTCLWQVSGRSDVDFETWMKMDLEYIDSWSLGLDVRIFLKTIPTVLSRKGAM
jgi:exopolysaccharide biosynthesis polyprenyl glycosylphosphotransferase